MNIGIGKLSQQQNQSQTEFVPDDGDRLTQLFGDKSLELLSCFLVTDSTMQIKYKKKETDLRINRRAQMCKGASITALARIHLDQALRTLQRHGCQLIYSDTGVYK